MTTLGLEVELMATPELDRTNRRDQLGAFFDAVAGYVDVDGDASLAGYLLATALDRPAVDAMRQAAAHGRAAAALPGSVMPTPEDLELDVIVVNPFTPGKITAPELRGTP